MPNYEISGENSSLEKLRGGHSFKDACSVKVSRFNPIAWIVASKRHAQMKNRLSEQLAKHEMLEKGKYVPLSEFKSGIFYLDQYPSGTIIRVRAESLFLHNNGHNKDGEIYGETKQFGFIVDTSGIIKDGENAVLYIKDGIICGGDFQNIKIGEVRHQKLNSPDGKTLYNLVEKVTSVEVVLPGLGFKERRKATMIMEKPHTIFVPVPQL